MISIPQNNKYISNKTYSNEELLNRFGLYPYGIFKENSDIRAHVTNGLIYVFKTSYIIENINSNTWPQTFAYQKNCSLPTAYGYLIKPETILDFRKLVFSSWDKWSVYNNDWNTTEKGKWAVNCITDLLKIGRFPLWLDAKQTEDKKIDIDGTDILLYMNLRIQVKCDYPARDTGNVFIQTHERNPLKLF